MLILRLAQELQVLVVMHQIDLPLMLVKVVMAV